MLRNAAMRMYANKQNFGGNYLVGFSPRMAGPWTLVASIADHRRASQQLGPD